MTELTETHECGTYRAGIDIEMFEAREVRDAQFDFARFVASDRDLGRLVELASIEPLDRYEGPRNVLLNNGINAGLLSRLAGVSGTVAYDNANARLGVGNSATAAVATQTGLLGGANTAYKAMNSGYPPAPSNQQLQYQASFTELEALFVWNEWGLLNGAAGGGSTVQLNRAVISPTPNGGAAKPNTQIWVLTATLGFS